MTRPLVLTRVAHREFDEATDWYNERRAGLGAEFVAEVNRTLDAVRAHPERLPPVYEELREAEVKRFPYAVYYRVEDHRIVVVAVFHTARDPAVWQSRA